MRSPPMTKNAAIVTADLLHRVPTITVFGLLAVAALHDIGFRTLPDTVSIALLGYHPNAFASLEEAFAPEANVRYAIAFLMDLRRRTDWTTATGNAATSGLPESYARWVLAVLNEELLGPAFPPSEPLPSAAICRMSTIPEAARPAQV